MNNDALVSVITPVLNGRMYLDECIQSVLNQSYPHIEHIFVDGGSTDGTLEVLTSYRDRYPDQVRFISEPDKGPHEAWNKGWKIARGEIFGELGADDTYEPDAVMTVIEFFRENRDVYFVYGDCRVINGRGERIAQYGRDFDLKVMINDTNCIPCPSAFYKREVIERIGFLDASLPYAHDFDYWIRVGKVFRIYRLEKVLSNFRIHEGSVGGSPEIGKTYIREGFIISRRHGGSLFSPRAKRYYKMVMIEGPRPVLGWAYPFLSKVLRMMRFGIKKLLKRGVIANTG